MKAYVLAIGAAAAVAAGACREDPCAPDHSQPDLTRYDAVVEEADGRVAIYSGANIKDRLARGDDVEAATSLPAFLRVRIPAALVQLVRDEPHRRRIFSLEEHEPGVELTLHMADFRATRRDQNGCFRPTRAESSILVPGQPWLSGHMVVRLSDDGALRAGAHILKHSGTLPFSTSEVSWGFVGCAPSDPATPDCPPLKYGHPDICRWPPLPPDWLLVPLMGQPADLDVLCGRKP